jgi:hypothetical protein
MMKGVRAMLLRALAAGSIAATCTGCPAVDVVVAEQDASFEAAAPEGGPETCSSNDDCPVGIAFCAKTSCEATTGVCQARPDTCDNTEQEYCGCDGVYYWNQCLWQRDGVSFAMLGDCTTRYRECGGLKGPCPVNDAVCAHLDSSGTGGAPFCMLPGGVCWVLPDACPADATGTQWTSCDPQMPSCTDLCDAARSGKPYFRVTSQTCP